MVFKKKIETFEDLEKVEASKEIVSDPSLIVDLLEKVKKGVVNVATSESGDQALIVKYIKLAQQKHKLNRQIIELSTQVISYDKQMNEIIDKLIEKEEEICQ